MKRLARFPDDRLRVAGVGLAFVLALGILSFVDQRAIDKHRASHVCQETGCAPWAVCCAPGTVMMVCVIKTARKT
ncbi:hypothetical protein, partial [Thiolapillus sp.]